MLGLVFAILIAILDTGIAEHPRFDHTVISGDIGDTCGHGTAMAGIVLDSAPQVQLLSVDVDRECHSTYGTMAAAIREAADAGAQIILVAWGVQPDLFGLPDATAYAEAQGAIVVYSEGLGTTITLAPTIDGSYAIYSGPSVTAAIHAGQLAWSLLEDAVYLPLVNR
jgi:hypothetical protein